jgi:outer membrane protein OmpA-like peptidoglycan-associated protein
MERPIDSNDTAAGRQNNRRVEFHIDDEAAR